MVVMSCPVQVDLSEMYQDQLQAGKLLKMIVGMNEHDLIETHHAASRHWNKYID